jgi:hypothetical protein
VRSTIQTKIKEHNIVEHKEHNKHVKHKEHMTAYAWNKNKTKKLAANISKEHKINVLYQVTKNMRVRMHLACFSMARTHFHVCQNNRHAGSRTEHALW